MRILSILVLLFMSISSEAQVTDYSQVNMWAAHPAKVDASDTIPDAFRDDSIEQKADAFFIHPTTYTGTAINNEWNAKVDNNTLNTYTDTRSIINQASVFNGSCRVYAPRYRQAHIRAFYNPYSDASKKAFDVAYSDVKAAFEYYLVHYNQGTPIVIAAHSQGSLYALRLLQDFFSGKPLRKQLVCAFVVGFPVTRADLKDIPFTAGASSTGCVISWQTYKTGYLPQEAARQRPGALCTNPVTWVNSEEPSPFEAHKGGFFQGVGVHGKLLSAQVNTKAGILWIKLLPQVAGLAGNMNNYHVADFNLFYADIRENVKLRIDTFLKR